MTSNYDAVKRMKQKYASLGLCSAGCGKSLHNKTLCNPCRIKYNFIKNKNRKARRKELVKNGFCSENCGRKSVSKIYCKPCGLEHNKRGRIRYFKNIKKSRKISLEIAHRKNFGGLRDKTLQRDSETCQICLNPKLKIIVHHIDENPKNNTLENLVCLCIACHKHTHQMYNHSRF